MNAPAIAVVIPYFQRKPGILRRALESVFAQVNAPPYEILVIDDESPIPAADEVLALQASCQDNLRIILQSNGGPGLARNTGLQAVRVGTRYVAFLDSDDEWLPHHLEDAHFALERGFDFYFADHYQLGRDVSAFKRAEQVDFAAHPIIFGRDYLHIYDGDMVNQIITGNLIGTSTVVFSYQKFSFLRFRKEFQNAGEDYLFWLDVAAQKATFAFSSRCDARYGAGVNVYSGAGWGTDAHLLRVHDEMKYRKLTRKLFPMSSAQKQLLSAKIEDLRGEFVGDILHRLAHLERISLRLLMKHVILDPMTFLRFLPISISIFARRKH